MLARRIRGRETTWLRIVSRPASLLISALQSLVCRVMQAYEKTRSGEGVALADRAAHGE